MTKAQTKQFERLKAGLGITTKAEEVVLMHLFKRDCRREILVTRWGDIKEYDTGNSRWVKITSSTNKHTFNFSALASRLEEGDESELYRKID